MPCYPILVLYFLKMWCWQIFPHKAQKPDLDQMFGYITPMILHCVMLLLLLVKKSLHKLSVNNLKKPNWTTVYCECVSLPLCHYPAVVSSDICLPQPLWMTLPTLKCELTPFSFVFLCCFCRTAKVSLSLGCFLGSFSLVSIYLHSVFPLLLS